MIADFVMFQFSNGSPYCYIRLLLKHQLHLLLKFIFLLALMSLLTASSTF